MVRVTNFWTAITILFCLIFFLGCATPAPALAPTPSTVIQSTPTADAARVAAILTATAPTIAPTITATAPATKLPTSTRTPVLTRTPTLNAEERNVANVKKSAEPLLKDLGIDPQSVTYEGHQKSNRVSTIIRDNAHSTHFWYVGTDPDTNQARLYEVALPSTVTQVVWDSKSEVYNFVNTAGQTIGFWDGLDTHHLKNIVWKWQDMTENEQNIALEFNVRNIEYFGLQPNEIDQFINAVITYSANVPSSLPDPVWEGITALPKSLSEKLPPYTKLNYLESSSFVKRFVFGNTDNRDLITKTVYMNHAAIRYSDQFLFDFVFLKESAHLYARYNVRQLFPQASDMQQYYIAELYDGTWMLQMARRLRNWDEVKDWNDFLNRKIYSMIDFNP